MTFYILGVILVFISILLLGSVALAHDKDNERDILDLLLSLVIMPWFSWLLILVVVTVILFTWLTGKGNTNES